MNKNTKQFIALCFLCIPLFIGIKVFGQEVISVAPIVDKVLLTQKFDLNVLTPVEAQQWVQMADQEVKKCGSMNFPDFDSTKTDVLKEINSRIEQGKC